ELAERIERLDRALDRSRAVLMARYARVERRLAELAPAPTPAPAPARRPPPRRPPPRPAPPAPAATVDVRDLQRSLNEFTGRHLKGVSPLAVDGKNGPETRRRIRLAKHYLGYTGARRRSTAVDAKLVPRLRHPRSARHSSPAMLARALTRRRDQRKAAGRATAARAGVVTFDGQPVAAWMEPYLRWAREHGWQGRLTSGWRDPAYSEQLCRAMCGAATCPGRCAGRTSNHVGRVRPAGAIDVTDEVRFAELMRRCPYSPRRFNDLPSDRIHFSATGH
ncbi:MAG TPA: hypothetical protein VLB47_14105, partial [Solirubrobacteraceae bacterium]|nr:hypothetical protein [Solirubrobacteraceae bacterium]